MERQQPRRLEWAVTEAQTGQNIHTLLRQSLGLSGTVIKRIKWLEDGILLDGVRAITSQRVRAGQLLSVRVSDPDGPNPMVPTPGPLDIVYEDDDLLVLNKAPGLLVHPGPGHYADTICNFLAYYYQQTGSSAQVHPVQRLDKGTSGLMVVAKHPHAQEKLKGQLHTPQFRRIYLAVCEGIPRSMAGMVDAPIGRVPGSLMARQVDRAGQPARTHYQVICSAGGRSLVKLALETGRTHQIRVHMAHLGCPLTGDFLYGREDQNLIPRPALHSWKLHLSHPIYDTPLHFTQPLPPDMMALLPDGFSPEDCIPEENRVKSS